MAAFANDKAIRKKYQENGTGRNENYQQSPPPICFSKQSLKIIHLAAQHDFELTYFGIQTGRSCVPMWTSGLSSTDGCVFFRHTCAVQLQYSQNVGWLQGLFCSKEVVQIVYSAKLVQYHQILVHLNGLTAKLLSSFQDNTTLYLVSQKGTLWVPPA